MPAIAPACCRAQGAGCPLHLVEFRMQPAEQPQIEMGGFCLAYVIQQNIRSERGSIAPTARTRNGPRRRFRRMSTQGSSRRARALSWCSPRPPDEGPPDHTAIKRGRRLVELSTERRLGGTSSTRRSSTASSASAAGHSRTLSDYSDGCSHDQVRPSMRPLAVRAAAPVRPVPRLPHGAPHQSCTRLRPGLPEGEEPHLAVLQAPQVLCRRRDRQHDEHREAAAQRCSPPPSPSCIRPKLRRTSPSTPSQVDPRQCITTTPNQQHLAEGPVRVAPVVFPPAQVRPNLDRASSQIADARRRSQHHQQQVHPRSRSPRPPQQPPPRGLSNQPPPPPATSPPASSQQQEILQPRTPPHPPPQLTHSSSTPQPQTPPGRPQQQTIPQPRTPPHSPPHRSSSSSRIPHPQTPPHPPPQQERRRTYSSHWQSQPRRVPYV